MVYHVLNRSNAGMTLFESDDDFAAFESVLERARERAGAHVLAYCVMPNHWHMVLAPESDAEVSNFLGWLTLTHAQRWHAAHGTAGGGHVYQGRFKSFPVQHDRYFERVCRYVERNPLRAGLVARAEDWRWSSLWRRTHGDAAARALLTDWPYEQPADWLTLVNQPQTDAELAELRTSAQRGRPFGEPDWVAATVARLGLTSTLRGRGRPKKVPDTF